MSDPPLVWYHGESTERTDWSEQRWDRDPSQSSLNESGPGLYFTNSLTEALNYGPYVYRIELPHDFNLVPARKASIRELKRFHNLASETDQNRFMQDWAGFALHAVLRKYTYQGSLYDSLLGLYGDLFKDPSDWIGAIIELGYHGVVVQRARSRHLIIWSLRHVKRIERCHDFEDEAT